MAARKIRFRVKNVKNANYRVFEAFQFECVVHQVTAFGLNRFTVYGSVTYIKDYGLFIVLFPRWAMKYWNFTKLAASGSKNGR